MTHKLAILALAVAGVVAAVTAVCQSRGTDAVVPPAPQLPAGHEEPVPGATFLNGYNVANIGPCTFQDRYVEAGPLLGPPIGPFTGRTQDFLFGRLVCVPANPAGSRVLFDDLGLAELRLQGLTPQPDAEPHLAVRAHVLDALETGLNPQEIYGRVISQARCDRVHRCTQYTDKQRLEFDDAAGAPVRWAPLGCLLNRSCQAATTAGRQAATARANRTLVAVVAVLGLAALGTAIGWTALRRGGRRAGGAVI